MPMAWWLALTQAVSGARDDRNCFLDSDAVEVLFAKGTCAPVCSNIPGWGAYCMCWWGCPLPRSGAVEGHLQFYQKDKLAILMFLLIIWIAIRIIQFYVIFGKNIIKSSKLPVQQLKLFKSFKVFWELLIFLFWFFIW